MLYLKITEGQAQEMFPISYLQLTVPAVSSLIF